MKTTKEKHHRLLEFLGWKRCPEREDECNEIWTNGNKQCDVSGLPPLTFELVQIAFQKLTREQKETYSHMLSKICCEASTIPLEEITLHATLLLCLNSTIEQRLDAFIETLQEEFDKAKD